MLQQSKQRMRLKHQTIKYKQNNNQWEYVYEMRGINCFDWSNI